MQKRHSKKKMDKGCRICCSKDFVMRYNALNGRYELLCGACGNFKRCANKEEIEAYLLNSGEFGVE